MVMSKHDPKKGGTMSTCLTASGGFHCKKQIGHHPAASALAAALELLQKVQLRLAHSPMLAVIMAVAILMGETRIKQWILGFHI